MPFHAKALLQRLNRLRTGIQKARLNHGEPDFLLELHKGNDGELYGRLGRTILTWSSRTHRFEEIELVLAEPFTRQEVADFLRLGICFGVKLCLIFDEIADGEALVKKAAAFSKGIDKIRQIEIMSTNDFLSRKARHADDWRILAFSLWARNDDLDLLTFFQEYISSRLRSGAFTRFSLLFGNERAGISRDLRKVCDKTFHVGPAMSEPLRASQACAYALALLRAAECQEM
jgi:tRNA(Leu) C34 or U34 (ribose-2'-O)-methylase TrmL